MKITRLRTRIVHLPIDPPIVTARATAAILIRCLRAARRSVVLVGTYPQASSPRKRGSSSHRALCLLGSRFRGNDAECWAGLAPCDNLHGIDPLAADPFDHHEPRRR